MSIIELKSSIAPQVSQLQNHFLYKKIDSLEKLRFFMERHVYAVFDFMSLAKALQNEFAPVSTVWLPPKDPKLARFVNEIILAEESDECAGRTFSHFEMYIEAMNEIGANSDLAMNFISEVREYGVDRALEDSEIPKASVEFSKYTFNLVRNSSIHEIASAFCFGREKVIPIMFQSILDKMNIKEKDAPMFHLYLNRHIEIDGDSHGPLALKIIENLCGSNTKRWEEAKQSAIMALDNRLKFWDALATQI